MIDADEPPPGLGDRLHDRAAPFDRAVEAAFDRMRGNTAADLTFYKLSELGDFSLIWHILGAARALGAPDPQRALLRSTGLLGLESLIVNQGVKRAFRRTRPDVRHDHPHRLRTPLTTSFPSGHASSAFFAASLLADGSRLGPLYYTLAAAVAASRIHVRIHHPSDVLAGAALGLVMGRMARRWWPRPRAS